MATKDAEYKFTWRSGVRLKEITRAWAKLPKPYRTTPVLLFATDAAHLDRKFVADRMNAALVGTGLDPIITKEDVGAGAGDE